MSSGPTSPASNEVPVWPYATLSILIAVGHALDIVSTWLAFIVGGRGTNQVSAFIVGEWGVGGIMLAKTFAVLLVEALLLLVICTPALRRRGRYAIFGLASCGAGALFIWIAGAYNLVMAIIVR